jgi:5,5'-dehydrodivanillate O-demethylase
MLRRYWHPVIYSYELRPGQLMPLKLLNENFTLYRGESGEPYIVGFHCAHRKTQLSLGWVEDENVRCFYHGWMFDGAGQCVAQPAEPSEFCEKVRIPRYYAEEYLGMIFAYVGEGSPPPLPRYAEFEYLDRVEPSEESFVRACNWFQGVENGADPVHALFVHIRGERDGRRRRFPVPEFRELDAGVYVARDGRTTGGIVFPNVHPFTKVIDDPRIELGPLPTLVWEVPIDDETHRQIGVQKLPAPMDDPLIRNYHQLRAERYARYESAAELSAAVLAGNRFRQDVDTSRTHAFTFEDDLAQVGQGHIEDRRGERLGRTDAGVILVRKMWQGELRKLASDQPLREWRWIAPEAWGEPSVPLPSRVAELAEVVR